MSGASEDDWVLVAAPPAAASGAHPIFNDATVATAARRADGRERRPEPRGSGGARSDDGRDGIAEAAEIRPFDRLPDDGLAKVLAVLKQSEHRRVESVCQRWRQIRPRASAWRARQVAALPRQRREHRGAALPEQPGGLLLDVT